MTLTELHTLFRDAMQTARKQNGGKVPDFDAIVKAFGQKNPRVWTAATDQALMQYWKGRIWQTLKDEKWEEWADPKTVAMFKALGFPEGAPLYLQVPRVNTRETGES